MCFNLREINRQGRHKEGRRMVEQWWWFMWANNPWVTIPMSLWVWCLWVQVWCGKSWPMVYLGWTLMTRELQQGCCGCKGKTCGSVHKEEVIDLTTDGPPEEFVMLVNLPSCQNHDMVKSKGEGCSYVYWRFNNCDVLSLWDRPVLIWSIWSKSYGWELSSLSTHNTILCSIHYMILPSH